MEKAETRLADSSSENENGYDADHVDLNSNVTAK